MKLLVVLVAAVFTAGCNANIVLQSPPKRQVDMVKDAFWDYVAKATTTADVSLKQIRQSELGQDSLVASSSDTISQLTDALRAQVSPLTQNLVATFSQEAEQLKARLEKDLSAVSTNAYVQEMMATLQSKVEELKKEAETVDTDALKELLLQRSQELKLQLDQNVEQLQTQMVPYAEDMKQKAQQNLDLFQKRFEAHLAQKTQEVRQRLAPYEDELRAKLTAEGQNLKDKLTALWEAFRILNTNDTTSL
uniref:Apolipoprotein A-IV a n=1 Tax=Stegastes partitus TaxID=144197 RepID=A0A3B5AE45_9TELE